MFALGLLAYAVVEVLARAFYALQDTWTPAWAAVLSVVLNIVLGVILPLFFRSTRIPPYAGLALANAIATTAEMLILLIIIYRRIGGFDVRGTLVFSARALFASLGMGAAVWAWLRFAPPFSTSRRTAPTSARSISSTAPVSLTSFSSTISTNNGVASTG